MIKTMMLATFAGGCFWCLQPQFDAIPGVSKTTVGYTGGQMANPTYEQVCSGKTGHLEAIEIEYDPKKVSYKALVDTFWKLIDPTVENRQFADVGTQYQTAIFYHSETQHDVALASKQALQRSKKFGDKPIMVKILPSQPFYPAETYHQCYYKKNPVHYELYKEGSGRAEFIRSHYK